MRRVKLTLLICLVACLCSGCAPLVQVVDMTYGENLAADMQALAHIGFSNGTLLEEDMQALMTKEELTSAQVLYTEYRSNIAYDSLASNEQLIYRAFEYAMEHQYTNILLDQQLVDSPDTFGRILMHLALDSPLLEQNLRYHIGSFETVYPIDILGIYQRQVPFHGYYISVENFDKKLWSQKMQALEEAKKVVATLPENITETEKARRLYQYVAGEISYIQYVDLQTPRSYLYDALIEKKTHCDGFSNSLALLLRLAGIENVEKIYAAKSSGVGHTWNFCCLDGKWYNMDGTGAKSFLAEEADIGSKLYFAYPDELQSYEPDYGEIYAVSDEGIGTNVDLHIENIANAKVPFEIQKIYNAKRSCLLLANKCNKRELERTMQVLADAVQESICWTSYNVIGEKCTVYIYRP